MDLRFNEEQYQMLLRCSENRNMSEWNEWRKKNPKGDVLLEGAKLQCAYLKGALLNTSLNSGFSGDVHLEHAKLHGAHLESADISDACLQGAKFLGAHLEGVDMRYARLEGADFSRAIVDGGTLIWKCEVGHKTKFEGVGLDAARIYPELKQLLEYNIRRMNWEEWYPQQHWLLRWLVRKFWQISDYGISTKQVIKTFFQLALIFAAVYLAWGLIDYHLVGLKDDPGIVSNLFVLEGEQETVSPWLVPFRAVYFSIVTMTTLGFGDMYATTHSFLRGLFGHVLLALQVILGYVLLAALVTRFAVLFTAGGPAGKFMEKK